MTSALDGGGWSTSRFTPGKDPVPIVYHQSTQRSHRKTSDLP